MRRKCFAAWVLVKDLLDRAQGNPVVVEEAATGICIDTELDFGLVCAADVIGQFPFPCERWAGSTFQDSYFRIRCCWFHSRTPLCWGGDWCFYIRCSEMRIPDQHRQAAQQRQAAVLLLDDSSKIEDSNLPTTDISQTLATTVQISGQQPPGCTIQFDL